MSSAVWVNQARRAAGLSQRELSRRSGVAQSAIARVERGQQVPRADTLERLLIACGFELRLGPVRGAAEDRRQPARSPELTPPRRLDGGVAAAHVAEAYGSPDDARTMILRSELHHSIDGADGAAAS